jgi:serine phosphatase RsbU (regulator of sigma subunit)
LFGKERLLTIIREYANAEAEEILKAILSEIKRFRGSQAPTDDVTLVIIKIK